MGRAQQDPVATTPVVEITAGRAIARLAQHAADSVFVDPFHVL
jgi:hypothetical protein